VLAILGTFWSGAWLLATAPVDAPSLSSLSSLTAVAALALLGALTAGAMRRAVAAGSRPAFAPIPVRPRSTRGDETVPRLFDPDAAGRPRPRAPSADPAA
jgi:hypothetical protein